MSDLNVFAFTGRLGADAELTYTQNGTAIWTARVAVDYGWGVSKSTSWLNVKALGKQAESLGKLDLMRGAQIGGSGELQVREYDKRDGGKGTAVEVLVGNVALIGSKPDGTAPRRERGHGESRKPDQMPAGDLQDDTPF